MVKRLKRALNYTGLALNRTVTEGWGAVIRISFDAFDNSSKLLNLLMKIPKIDGCKAPFGLFCCSDATKMPFIL